MDDKQLIKILTDLRKDDISISEAALQIDRLYRNTIIDSLRNPIIILPDVSGKWEKERTGSDEVELKPIVGETKRGSVKIPSKGCRY